MARNTRAGKAPFTGFAVCKLEAHRLVLPANIDAVVGWVSTPLETLAVPGVGGGLVLLPPEALAEHREVQARLRGQRFRVEDLGSPSYLLGRVGAVAWEVNISTERRFTLPLGARDMKLVPEGETAQVAVVAVGDSAIEVWDPEVLKAWMQAAAGKWEGLKRGAGLDLEHREENAAASPPDTLPTRS